MPYNLYITRSNGRETKALRSPYQDRESTGQTVRMVAIGAPPYDNDFAHRLAKLVVAAPLGQVVNHPDTPLKFRTESAD